MTNFTLLPAVDKEFINREKLLLEMLTTLKEEKSRLGFALYGKRRVGKTSILKELERRLSKNKKIVPVYFSLFDLTERTIEAFSKEFSSSILDAYQKKLGIKHKAKELIKLPFTLLGHLLKDIKIDLEVKNLITLSLGFDKRNPLDADKIIENAFDLPEKLAIETKTKCILFLDEFPEIMDLKKEGTKIGLGIINKIRTIMEDKKHLSLNISGSIRKTMLQVAISSSSAFYRQFILKLIEPLDKKSIFALLQQNLPGRKFSPEALELFYEATAGFPFYAQFIGRIIQLLNVQKKIEPKDIQAAIDDFLQQEGNLLFREEFFTLSDNERKILLVMAQDKISNPGDLSQNLSASSSLIAKTLGYLMDKGIVEKKEKGNYSIEDPVFEKWLNSLTN